MFTAQMQSRLTRISTLVFFVALLTACGGGGLTSGGGGCGGPNVNVSGVWTGNSFSISNPQNPRREFRLVLRQEGNGNLSGSISSPPCFVDLQIDSGKVRDTGFVCDIEHEITFEANEDGTGIFFAGEVFIGGVDMFVSYVLKSTNASCPQVEAMSVSFRKI